MNVSNTFTESAFGSPLSAVNDWANNAWAQIYNNYTPQQIQFWGGVLIQFTTFWIPATIYVLVDVLFPEFSERHQYQEKKRQPKGREILRAALGSLQNNVAVTVLQYVGIFYVNKRPMFVVSPELPSLWTIAWQFVMGFAVREIIFYYVHRAFHHPRLYPTIHKKHHVYTAPVAYSAQYCTFTEHALANVLPLLVGHVVVRAHIVSAHIFVGYELWQAAADHAGYDFWKGSPSAKLHDLHHEKFRIYYSPLGIMDWLHGTNKLPERKEKKVE